MSTLQQTIYYEKAAKFEIIPTMNAADVAEFKEFILELESEYKSEHNKDCFFWDFNEATNSIVIKENVYAIELDIFNQFTTITQWLFNKDYYIRGSYYGQVDNIIECIMADESNKLINHYVLVDDDPIKTDTDQIISNAKDKIKSKINNNASKDTSLSFLIDCSSNKTGENELIIKSLNDRIIYLENQQKGQELVNKFLLRMCIAFSLLTAGTFIYLVVSGQNGN